MPELEAEGREREEEKRRRGTGKRWSLLGNTSPYILGHIRIASHFASRTPAAAGRYHLGGLKSQDPTDIDELSLPRIDAGAAAGGCTVGYLPAQGRCGGSH